MVDTATQQEEDIVPDFEVIPQNFARKNEAIIRWEEEYFIQRIHRYIHDVEIGRSNTQADIFPDSINTRWLDALKLYAAIRNTPREEYAGRSKIQSLKFFKLIESITSDQAQTIYPQNEDWFELVGRNPDDHGKAQRVKKFVQYLLQKADFQREMEPFLRNLPIYGTSVAKIWWERQFEDRIRREITQVPTGDTVTDSLGSSVKILEPKVKAIRKRRKVFDGVKVRFVPIEDFFIDFRAKHNRLEDWDCVERMQVTAEWLRGKEKQMNLKRLDEVFAEGSKKIRDLEESQHRRDKLTNSEDRIFLDKYYEKHDFTMWEWWGWENLPEDLDLEQFQNFKITGRRLPMRAWIINKKLIYLGINPYFDKFKPYLTSQWIVNPDGFYGWSAADIVKSWHYGITDRTNQMVDNVTFSLCAMFGVNEKALVNKSQDFIVNQFKRILFKTDPRTAMTDIRPPDMTGSGLSFIEYMGKEEQEALGASDSILGIAGDSPATNFTIANENASKKWRYQAFRQERDIVIDPVRKCIQFSQQFVNDNQWIRVIGPDGRTPDYLEMGPDDFYGDFEVDIVPLGMTALRQRTLQVQNLINFLNIAANLTEIDKKTIAMDIYKTMGLGNPEKIIVQNLNTPEVIAKARSENIALQYQQIPVLPTDRHALEIPVHEVEITQRENAGKEINNLVMHNAEHMRMLSIELEQQNQENGGQQEKFLNADPNQQTQIAAQSEVPRLLDAPNRPLVNPGSARSISQRLAS